MARVDILIIVLLAFSLIWEATAQGENTVDGKPTQGKDTAADGGTDNDDHGGVPMGTEAGKDCDDGISNIEKDYKNVDWCNLCMCMSGDEKSKPDDTAQADDLESDVQQPTHICTKDEITYDSTLPTSGAHRPLWPMFGEYLYLPPQRWLHSLEHGAVVFLYHPCTDAEQIKEFRAMAYSCLNKIIITPSMNLTEQQPFAVLAWGQVKGHKLLLPTVDKDKIKNFLIAHALKGPETNVAKEGQYDVGLLHGIGLKGPYEAPRDGPYEVTDDPICPTDAKNTPPTLDSITGSMKMCMKTMKKERLPIEKTSMRKCRQTFGKKRKWRGGAAAAAIAGKGKGHGGGRKKPKNKRMDWKLKGEMRRQMNDKQKGQAMGRRGGKKGGGGKNRRRW